MAVFRARMKKGKEKYLADVLTYLNSEGWAVQMRAFSRGLRWSCRGM